MAGGSAQRSGAAAQQQLLLYTTVAVPKVRGHARQRRAERSGVFVAFHRSSLGSYGLRDADAHCLLSNSDIFCCLCIPCSVLNELYCGFFVRHTTHARSSIRSCCRVVVQLMSTTALPIPGVMWACCTQEAKSACQFVLLTHGPLCSLCAASVGRGASWALLTTAPCCQQCAGVCAGINICAGFPSQGE
jgi:hypothetical protein